MGPQWDHGGIVAKYPYPSRRFHFPLIEPKGFLGSPPHPVAAFPEAVRARPTIHLCSGRIRHLGREDVNTPLRAIQGDDLSGCVSVSSSSARPSAGRYRPKFNSKSLGTP